ncbi:MAG: hypothetical protein ACRD29_05135 [Acidimicrobiales bacterium]
MIDSLETVLTSDEFRTGVGAGLIALLVGLAVGVVRGRRSTPLPIAGVLLVAAAAVAIAAREVVPARLSLGLALMAAGGLLIDVRWLPRLAAPVAAAPGASLIAMALTPRSVGWVRPAVVVAVVVGGFLIAEFDREWRRSGATAALVLIWLGGVYVTVPETERALVLLGAAVPLTLLGWPLVAASYGASGALVVVGLAAWVVGTDSATRASAVVGGLTAPGLLLAEPLTRLVTKRATGVVRRGREAGGVVGVVGIVGVVGLQVAVVLLITRVAGLQGSAAAAALIAGAVLAGTVVVWVVATGRRFGNPRT